MTIATKVYKRYLKSEGIKKTVWSFARHVLIKLMHDPLCTLKIFGRRLNLPLSHELPILLSQYRFYNQLPRRLSTYIHSKYGHLNCIDVGANIGDTLAAFYQNESDAFLAIEPNPTFFKLLSDNWGWNKNVILVSEICSSGSGEGTFVIHEGKGTASIIENRNGATMRHRSLDEIASEQSFASNTNVIKIDTDGSDFKVIAGSTELLARHLPAVYFECGESYNEKYVEDCLETMHLFRQSGYQHFLAYDSYGAFMGKYSLSDLAPFRNLLFYQLTSRFYYFDILVMADADLFPFYRAEIEYFIDQMPDKTYRRTARTSAGL